MTIRIDRTDHSADGCRATHSVTEAAAILGISRTTAYECVRTGELPSLRLRGRIVVPVVALEALIAATHR
jgi:excisionase family DNA binding protein